VVSTSLAEGIEDRITMAPLNASRLADMVRIGRRIVAIEMVVAAQAAELREMERLGAGTSAALRRLREQVPFLRTDADFPADLEPVVALVASLDVEAIARPVASSAAQA
jgi:histidine ammonia-lyase